MSNNKHNKHGNKNDIKGEVRHDYLYQVFRDDVVEGSPCDKLCGFKYKTCIPESAFSPQCAKCGTKMKFKTLRREISENQYTITE